MKKLLELHRREAFRQDFQKNSPKEIYYYSELSTLGLRN